MYHSFARGSSPPPSPLVRRAGISLAASLLLVLASPAGAGAATPGAGTYRDAGSGTGAGVAPQRVRLVVARRAGAARVAAVHVFYRLRCEDGSVIAGSNHLARATVRHGGGFAITSTAGGNYGPEGRISLTIRLGGRFTTPGTATGTFTVAALVTDSDISPARTCETGRVAWTSTLSRSRR